MKSQKRLIMDTWLIMNIHDSIVGIHNSVMDIRDLKYKYHSITAVHNSKLLYP